ncbi:tetratricopeptide repeat protein [Kaarinaea lacus]
MKTLSVQLRAYKLAACAAMLVALSCTSALAKVGEPGEVRDLHYGMVLFEFYQKNYFTAAVNLLAAQQQKHLLNSDAESRLLLGGLYLSYGLHTEAEEIFQAIIDEGASPEVRDRAWFFIGKIRYQKQLFREAEQALDRVGDALDKSLQPEYRILRSNLLMAQEKYPDAAKFLEQMFSKEEGPSETYADANYVRYNLGVALIRAGKTQEGVKLIEKVGVLKSTDPNIKALRDKANLALGYSFVKSDPERARAYLQQVRLNGPFSNRALLGLGWADAELQRYEEALVPWQELARRDRADIAVFESLLAIGNALERLKAYPQAMLSYQNAINSYEQELANLEKTVAAVKAGRLWNDLLAQVSGNEMGWFWEADLLPRTPEARYLKNLMADHGFHEAIKNLRDLRFLENKLSRWKQEIPALEYMLELRRKTYESQLTKLNPETTLNHVIDVRTSRDIYRNELREIEATNNSRALATEEEQVLLQRLKQVEERIWRLSNDPGFGHEKAASYRQRYDFLRGVLDYDIHTTFAIRTWKVKKSLKSLDKVLESTLAQQLSLQDARKGAPQRFEGYSHQIADYQSRVGDIQVRVKKAFDEQQQLLQAMVDEELDRIRLRLIDYLDRARFSLAHLQDLATNSGALQNEEEAK